MVCESHRRVARQFLQGLSTSEMEYIAEFLGSCLLTGGHPCQWSRIRLAEEIQRFDRTRSRVMADRTHKMVLLYEYLCRSVPVPVTVAARAARH